MKLTCDNVEDVFMKCLLKNDEMVDGKPICDITKAEGIISNFGFHTERLQSNYTKIYDMLLQFPDEFMVSKGGGHSFLNACMDKDGNQWGEHCNIEQLISLGVALKIVSYLLPRQMWKSLPGSVPYFCIHDVLTKKTKGERNVQV